MSDSVTLEKIAQWKAALATCALERNQLAIDLLELAKSDFPAFIEECRELFGGVAMTEKEAREKAIKAIDSLPWTAAATLDLREVQAYFWLKFISESRVHAEEQGWVKLDPDQSLPPVPDPIPGKGLMSVFDYRRGQDDLLNARFRKILPKKEGEVDHD